MNNKQAKKLNLAISIASALFMLLAAYIVNDKELSQNIILIVIAIWIGPFLYLSKKSSR